jgi:hypothetical protein
VEGQGFRARPLRGPLRSFPNLAQGCQSPTLDKGSRAAKRRLAASALASLAQHIAADAAPRGPRSFAPSLPLKWLPPRTTDEIAEAVNCVAFRVPANPFVIGRDGTHDDVCDKYEDWLPTQPKLMAMIPALAGYDLVCFCAPSRCHCDFLLRLANPTSLYCD